MGKWTALFSGYKSSLLKFTGGYMGCASTWGHCVNPTEVCIEMLGGKSLDSCLGWNHFYRKFSLVATIHVLLLPPPMHLSCNSPLYIWNGSQLTLRLEDNIKMAQELLIKGQIPYVPLQEERAHARNRGCRIERSGFLGLRNPVLLLQMDEHF